MKDKLENHCVRQIDTGEDFVGLKVTNEGFKVIFPYGYILPTGTDDSVRTEILDLLKTISLTKKYYGNNLGSDPLSDVNKPFMACLTLLDDYFSNGLIKKIDYRYERDGSGRIDWHRTFKVTPWITKSLGLFFPHVYTKVGLQEEDLLTQIEARCLNIAYEQIGWLLGKIDVPSSLVKDLKPYIPYLTKILSNTFVDRKKLLLQSMIEISENQGSNDLSFSKDFGTNSYFAVWEYMIRKVYGNVDESRFFPKGYYVMDDGSKYPASDLRPDVVNITKDDVCYIIDAKYYKYGITHNGFDLPQTSSIQKQFAYEDYAKRIGNFREIKSLFILPTNRPSLTHVGYCYTSSDDDRRVGVYILSSNELVRKFLRSEKEEIDSEI